MSTSVTGISFLIPLAVFAAFSASAWVIAERLWRRRSRAEERLDQLNRPSGAQGHASRPLDSVSSAMAEWMQKATPQLAKPLQPTNPQEASRLKQRLLHGGFRSEFAPSAFLALKLLLLAAGFFLGGGTMLFTTGFTQAGVLRVILAACIPFYVPDVVLFFLTKRRQQQIFLGLPDAIDLIVVCVEAGLGLDQAMRKVASEMLRSFPVVAREFGIANLQLQMGLDRVQVLRDLAYRNGEDDLRGLVSVMIQANKFGSGIGESLRVHSDSMRVRRRLVAEEKAAKCSVKLIFPLVLFIFPGIFVILVGPAAISIIDTLMPIIKGP